MPARTRRVLLLLALEVGFGGSGEVDPAGAVEGRWEGADVEEWRGRWMTRQGSAVPGCSVRPQQI